jgi:methyl-accepting chemotaxis protein
MRLMLAVGATAVAILAASCGADSSAEPAPLPTAEWASGVCTAIVTWTDSLQQVAAGLQSSSEVSMEPLRRAVDDTAAATERLFDDLVGLGPPETDAGAQAKTELDSLAATLRSSADSLRETVASSASAAAAVATASAVSSALGDMSRAVGDALSNLGDLDVTEEFRQAFRAADACDPLVEL